MENVLVLQLIITETAPCKEGAFSCC